ncbi:MAG: hypothetical protein BGO29_01830 [Bacteroidales bacterium 36-12]|nr:MAG: hypothetical protein BGO29_01830 [Bacteroidales bacterium 36-12]
MKTKKLLTILMLLAAFAGTVNAFTVSGRVYTSPDGGITQLPLEGVRVYSEAPYAAEAFTNASGNYSFEDVPMGTSMVIRAEKAGYTFIPGQIQRNVVRDWFDLDFMAIPTGGGGDGFSISGSVKTADQTPVSGVTINYDATKSVSTDANGNYSISGIKTPTIRLMPSKSNYIFSPVQIDLTMNKDYTGQNFTATHIGGGGDDPEQIPYTISGIVTVCEKPIEGAEIESRGKKSYSGADGSYTIADTVEKNGMWHSPMDATVSISKEGISFPGERSIHFTGNYDFNMDFSGYYLHDTITGKVSHGVSGQPCTGLELKWEKFLIPEGNYNNKTLIKDSVIITDNSGNYAAPFSYFAPGQTSRDYYQYAITPIAKGYSYGDITIALPSDRTCDALKNINIVATFIPVPVCMVSVSETNKNIIVWEKPLLEDAITGFKIYKEGNVANVYEVIATVPYAETAIYTDTDSDPSVKAYRYKIGTVTSYGYETELSSEHKTIHLTINKGIGNAWNLIWSHYEGLTISTYKLYRGTDKENMTFLTDIAGSLNSYTDNTAPAGDIYYQIEMLLANACDPEVAKPLAAKRAKAASSSYFSTKSNVVSTIATGTDEVMADNYTVYPNPVKDVIYFSSGEATTPFEIYSTQGALINRGLLGSSINVSDLQSGLYYLRINANNQWITYKFIKE